jgi:hypothetical protein
MTKRQAIIEYDSDAAAKPHTMTGWLAQRTARFYVDENTARWDGCTHIRCACGQLTEKYYTKCKRCQDKAETERFYARPVAKWDGKAMLFSDTLDEYFSDYDEAEERAAEVDWDDTKALRLIICEPVYARQLDSDFFCDDLPEDGDLPVEVEAAIEAFNKAVAGVVLSWRPGKYRMEA